MAGRTSGATQRRKLRRLRAAWRHEQQSIATTLASALQHSSDRTTRAQHEAPQGQANADTQEVASAVGQRPEPFTDGARGLPSSPRCIARALCVRRRHRWCGLLCPRLPGLSRHVSGGGGEGEGGGEEGGLATLGYGQPSLFRRTQEAKEAEEEEEAAEFFLHAL